VQSGLHQAEARRTELHDGQGLRRILLVHAYLLKYGKGFPLCEQAWGAVVAEKAVFFQKCDVFTPMKLGFCLLLLLEFASDDAPGVNLGRRTGCQQAGGV